MWFGINTDAGLYLRHYGVLGMKWGIVNKKSKLSAFDAYPINKETIKTDPRFKHLRVNSNTKGIIYKQKKQLVGFINTETKTDGTWIQALEVMPEYRQRGFAQEMVKNAIELGVTKLSVRETNTNAISLYKKLGFITYKTNNGQLFMEHQK